MVVIHPVHGIMLIETKESDMFDNKKRSRARMHLNAARQAFESVLRLILEAHGMKPSSSSDSHVPVYQFVALPNVREVPVKSAQLASSSKNQSGQQSSSSGIENNANTSSSSIGSTSSPQQSTRPNRALNYLIKSDLEDQNEFAKWWKRSVEEPSRLLAEARREEEEKRANEEREKRAASGEEKKDERKEKDEREKKVN